jgi:hypothetical protein
MKYLTSSPFFKKMKVSNIGIILLTLMVCTKYFISSNTLTHKDGLLRAGLVVDYTGIEKELFSTPVSSNVSPLLAYNQVNTVADQQNTEAVSKTTSRNYTSQAPTVEGYVVNETELPEGPAPVEYANTLVVYNPSNPVIEQMSSQYLEPEDSEPLDQGNTVISEMQLMMPRR